MVQVGYSCRCASHPPYFCQNVYSSTIVIQGKILNFETDDILTVIVLDHIQHDTDADTIRIIGHDGSNCGQIMNVFNEDETVIFNLRKIRYLADSIYYLSGCGINYLKQGADLVLGPISPGVRSRFYNDFKSEIEDCTNFVSVEIGHNQAESIMFYPSPMSQHLTVRGWDGSRVKFELYDVAGNLMRKDKLSDYNERTIDISDLHDGVYIIRIFNNKESLVRKIIKQSN